MPVAGLRFVKPSDVKSHGRPVTVLSGAAGLFAGGLIAFPIYAIHGDGLVEGWIRSAISLPVPSRSGRGIVLSTAGSRPRAMKRAGNTLSQLHGSQHPT